MAGSKGGDCPEVERVGRLHVVMAVDDERGFAGRAGPGGVDRRLAAAVEELHVGEAERAEAGQQEFAGVVHALRVGRVGAHARQPEQRFQALEHRVVLAFQPGHHCVAHALGTFVAVDPCIVRPDRRGFKSRRGSGRASAATAASSSTGPARDQKPASAKAPAARAQPAAKASTAARVRRSRGAMFAAIRVGAGHRRQVHHHLADIAGHHRGGGQARQEPVGRVLHRHRRHCRACR